MMTRRTTRRGSQRRGLATFLLVVLAVFGLTFAGSAMGAGGGMFAAYAYFSADLPDPNVLDGIEPAESTYVYDRTGSVLLARFECQNREAVEFEELPPLIWEATIASEDRTFWDNSGVDFQGLVRAALANLALSVLLVGPLGLAGVALGTLIPTTLVSLGLMLPYALRALGISFSEALQQIYLPVFGPTLPASALLWAISSAFDLSSGLALGLAAGLSVLAYLTGYFLLGATAPERRMVRELLSHRLLPMRRVRPTDPIS